MRYLDLYRRSKINEAVYELLSKEYEVIKIQEARNMPTVQVLDQPVVPEKKAHPHRLIVIAGGTGFGVSSTRHVPSFSCVGAD